MIGRMMLLGSLMLAGAPVIALASAPTPAKHESPFACSPSALTPAERKKHFEVDSPKLRAVVQGIREFPNGYEFEFASSPDTYRTLSEWMYQERLCCPFFDLELRIDREGGPLWLRLTGRDGVKSFITDEFAPMFSAIQARP